VAVGEEPDLFLGRGYTGHEHLAVFGLINMNARLYDPALGRFLSPDPYVQAPDFSQNFNRYSYCLNNPLRFTDPSGKFIFGWLSGVMSGLWRGVSQSKNVIQSTWDGFRNGVKIDWGLYKGTPKQIFSRFTIELPQTIVGNTYSQFRNLTWSVDQVRYFDGATYVINEKSGSYNGVTLGSYINMNIREEYDRSKYEPNGKFTPVKDVMFMHEYGHYIQSQKMGLKYLFEVGIPSLIDAAKSEQRYGYVYDSKGGKKYLSSHSIYSVEIDANLEAAIYFGEKYGIDWNGDDFLKYPTNYDEDTLNGKNWLYCWGITSGKLPFTK
jgi:RHS repeat-associated protein